MKFESAFGMKEQIDRLQELGWYHSIEVPGGPTIEGLQSIAQLRERLAQFPIPQDLRGKRVLDVGAWDGWFSFEMERRGAAVVAMDSAQHHRLLEAKALLQSSVECVTADICRVTPGDFGHFDYVLFFGVLYHLKHPLLALENVCALAKEAVFVESYICDLDSSRSDKPYLEFYEREELAGQFDNLVWTECRVFTGTLPHGRFCSSEFGKLAAESCSPLVLQKVAIRTAQHCD